MLMAEAERRIVVAANRDAELYQKENPGQPAEDLWAATRWALIVNEPEMVDAVLLLRDMAGDLYRESLRNAVRVLSQLVKLRIENWLDLVLAPDFRGSLSADQVEQLNEKLSIGNRALLIRAGGAAVVARYTELKPR